MRIPPRQKLCLFAKRIPLLKQTNYANLPGLTPSNLGAKSANLMNYPQRITKFRVWDKNHKEFLNRENTATYGWLYSLSGSLRASNLEFILDNPKDYIVTQFIGFLDTKGREIYEGDICRSYTHVGDREWGYVTGRIVYEPYDARYSKLENDEPDTQIGGRLIPGSEEILGNIFENPELLEIKDEKKVDRGAQL